MSDRTKTKRDIHAEITVKLIAAVEANPEHPGRLWGKSTGKPLWMPTNAQTKNRYNGINILALWAEADLRGFTHPIWATYRQWAAMGCQVRKGETASTVVFYKELTVQPEPDDADDDGKRYVAKASCVFNASQVDGYDLPEPPALLGPVERIAAAETFFDNIGARVEIGGDRAFYSPSTDHIQMPTEGLFSGSATMTRTEGWYSTLGHEHIHRSGTEKRMNRTFGKRFGDDAYAFEELVACIGETFLCAELGLMSEPRQDHAHYLANWLKVMKGDSRAIFTAAAAASKAVAFLKVFQPKAIDDASEETAPDEAAA